MPLIKIKFILALALLGLQSTGEAACGSAKTGNTGNNAGQMNQTQMKESPATTPTPVVDEKEKVLSGESKEIKVLAQGGSGTVEEPFVIVARDAAVYDELRKLVGGLPDAGAQFFTSRAIIAAFLGTRMTGGYSINITRAADGVLVVGEQTPSQDALTTQALTSPFVVASVPVSDEEGIGLQPEGKWAEKMLRLYRITAGEFQSGGGFAGHMEQFTLEGAIGVARYERLATLAFDLKAVGSKRPRGLRSVATTIVAADDHVEIVSTDAGSLVERPRSPLRVTGQFASGESRLALKFESLPPRLADGYGGNGQLEAAATVPSRAKPAKRKPAEP